MPAYADGRGGGDGGKGYCFEGEFPSIKRLGNSPFGVFYLLCLLLTVDSSSSAVAFQAVLAENMSNVSCFCLCRKICLQCIIALSLMMCTALFANIVS